MTALLEGARKLVTRGSGIGSRLEGLDAAASAAAGRLDDDLVEHARGVVDRASNRLRLSAEHTVVAIAGATGSGKSSTFNALTGLDLAAVGSLDFEEPDPQLVKLPNFAAVDDTRDKKTR